MYARCLTMRKIMSTRATWRTGQFDVLLAIATCISRRLTRSTFIVCNLHCLNRDEVGRLVVASKVSRRIFKRKKFIDQRAARALTTRRLRFLPASVCVLACACVCVHERARARLHADKPQEYSVDKRICQGCKAAYAYTPR